MTNLARWADAGIVDRTFYLAAGRVGLLGLAVPDQYGGGGVDDARASTLFAGTSEDMKEIIARSLQ